MFSQRSRFDLTPNRYARLLAELRHDGGELLDLSESNPTSCGLAHDPDRLAAALADTRAWSYQPQALGLASARAAVAAYYAERGVAVDPERVLLTASTSEAYGWLFTLLADPGERVLAGAPSYPLFDYLAALSSLELDHYPLELDGGPPEAAAAQGALHPDTRVLLAVSPNNPTGHVWDQRGLAALDTLAAGAGLALVVDEVFADFMWQPVSPPVAASEAREALTFSLSGLSKVAGLPQLKLGWVVLGGPERLLEEAHARLELFADTWLSVATPVQRALPRLLELGREFRDRCRRRIAANLACLRRALAQRPELSLLPAAGGWYACLRVPRTEPEEQLVLRLLREQRVLVHPGYFYAFPGESWLVLSLIVSPEVLERALERLLPALPSGA